MHLTTSFLLALSFFLSKLARSSMFSLFWISSSCSLISEARRDFSSATCNTLLLSYVSLHLALLTCFWRSSIVINLRLRQFCAATLFFPRRLKINWSIEPYSYSLTSCPGGHWFVLHQSGVFGKTPVKNKENISSIFSHKPLLTLNSSMLMRMIFSVCSSSRPRARALCWSLQCSEII